MSSTPPKTAVIGGASSGVGAAAARMLAREGYELHLMARREPELRALADELGAGYTVVDLADPAASERALAGVQGPVGVALYAAGTMSVSSVSGHPVDAWEQTIAVNLTGAFLFARGMIERMAPGARIFFISSVAAAKGLKGQSAYAASKAGLERFAESLSSELEPEGIGVHVIAPGPVATPMLDIPGTSPFQLDAEEVVEVMRFLIGLPPDVVMRHVLLRPAISGPFARRRHDG